MPTLNVTLRDGTLRVIQADAGARSVMEVLRDNGVDDILALCGGACACATCHIYVDTAAAADLSPLGEDEDDLLDSSDHRQSGSRLSCQVSFTDALDGLAITVAPAD